MHLNNIKMGRILLSISLQISILILKILVIVIIIINMFVSHTCEIDALEIFSFIGFSKSTFSESFLPLRVSFDSILEDMFSLSL